MVATLKGTHAFGEVLKLTDLKHQGLFEQSLGPLGFASAALAQDHEQRVAELVFFEACQPGGGNWHLRKRLEELLVGTQPLGSGLLLFLLGMLLLPDICFFGEGVTMASSG